MPSPHFVPISPRSIYPNNQDFLLNPPCVPAHGGAPYSLTSPEDSPSPVPSSRSSSTSNSSGGLSPHLLPPTVPSISSRNGALASTGNIAHDQRPPQPRRNSIINPYPLSYDGVRSPTRSRFGGQPPIVGSGLYDTVNGRSITPSTAYVGLERTIKSLRRPSQTQDENFPPAMGAQVRRSKVVMNGRANYELVRVGMFQNPQMCNKLTAVQFFTKGSGSTEPGIRVGDFAKTVPVMVTGGWFFEGIADRELNIELSWPGIPVVNKRRLNIAAMKNEPLAYIRLAEMLVSWVIALAGDAQRHEVHSSYEHLRLTTSQRSTGIYVADIVIGGLYHRDSSRWEIQMWAPKPRQM